VRTAAVLPVKRFSQAKQRLGASVGERRRLELAPAMVEDVLLSLSRCALVERTIVVTREPVALLAAARAGAIAIEDSAESGQSAAALIGIEYARSEGFERVMCVPGDCPALDPAELDELLCAGSERFAGGDTGTGSAEVVIIPDRHGTGTNGLLLTPPEAIRPSFGSGSFERHGTLARARGTRLRVERPPSLLLDVDTGADLAELQERLSGQATLAPFTRAVLSHSADTGAVSISSPAPRTPASRSS
jgi:2-phospho-L-lactate guanylyltransferase